jgi:hypothetical protein
MGRQDHPEERAVGWFALDGKTPAVPIDDVLDDGKAETGPALLATFRHVHPVESLGETRQMLWRDAWTIVADR